MYSVILSKDAAKELSKLDRSVQERFVAVFSRININPHNHVRKLSGTDLHRIRIGDYRAIIQIDDDSLEILVVKVGHRKNIYDNLPFFF